MENLQDNIKNNIGNLTDNIAEIKDTVTDNFDNIKSNIGDKAGDLKQNIVAYTPYGSDSFVANADEFFSSNTIIAKATFLLLIIMIFIFLFNVFSRLIFFMLTPSQSPYIVYGMKDATHMMTIPQSMGDKSSVPIYRSRDEYDGVEFTYSYWMYVNDLVYNDSVDYKHVFHKGSNTKGTGTGTYGPNNCPGVYLYTGKRNLSENLLEKYPLLGMLVRLNVYHNNDNGDAPYKYYDDVYIDGIPIKKWVHVVIRLTSQNIVDVYINGVLTKRHQLSNIVKQNYDNIYVNMGGGFSGNLSNLKYYNYAIGTFEIEKIVSAGPNLTIAGNNNINKSKPHYLSSDWYMNSADSDVIA